MSQPRVLLVCDYDPTSPLIGALRVDRFAVYLTELGWDVRVLSRSGVTRYDPMGRYAPSGAQDSHFERPLRTRWRRLLRRVMVEIYQRFVAFPDRGAFTVRQMLRHAVSLGLWRPDVIVVSGPPFSTFFVARSLSQRWSVPWVADYRDLWTNSTYYVCGMIRRRIDRVVERWLLRTVTLTTTVSEPLAEDLRRDFGVPANVVMNGFEPDETPMVDDLGPPEGLPVRLVYTGEIYEGKRDPAPVFQAAKNLGLGANDVRMVFRGITVLPVQEIADRYGVAHLVDVGPALPRAECLALQRSADVAMLLMWNDPGEVGVYSGKVFEYLGSGRPILMLGYEEGAAAELIRDRRAGHVANTPHAISEVLAAWVETKRKTGFVPGTGSHVVDGLTRRDQTMILSNLLKPLVPKR